MTKRRPSKTSIMKATIDKLKRGGGGRSDGKEAFDRLLKRAAKPKK